MNDAVSIPREEYDRLMLELENLRNTHLYKRLLEFEKNIKQGKSFKRKDLGF
jgi:PHD/YefM family antitoxin component YafN of YafNO toxin-antitoxin module